MGDGNSFDFDSKNFGSSYVSDSFKNSLKTVPKMDLIMSLIIYLSTIEGPYGPKPKPNKNFSLDISNFLI